MYLNSRRRLRGSCRALHPCIMSRAKAAMQVITVRPYKRGVVVFIVVSIQISVFFLIGRVILAVAPLAADDFFIFVVLVVMFFLFSVTHILYA